jgi:CRP-like cAMP-binding protein
VARSASRPAGKADLLRSVPLFAELSTAELNRLARLMDEVDVKEGTVVIREGNTGGEFFIIVEGEVAIRRGSRRLGTLGAGDFFGEIALIDKGPRSATAIAQTPCRLLVLASREFHSMLNAEPKVERKILRTLAARVREMRPGAAY